jgi:hypothetical protein
MLLLLLLIRLFRFTAFFFFVLLLREISLCMLTFVFLEDENDDDEEERNGFGFRADAKELRLFLASPNHACFSASAAVGRCETSFVRHFLIKSIAVCVCKVGELK